MDRLCSRYPDALSWTAQATFKVSVYIPNEHSRNRNVVVVGAKDAVGDAVQYINKVRSHPPHRRSLTPAHTHSHGIWSSTPTSHRVRRVKR